MRRFDIIRQFFNRRDGNLALMAAIVLPVGMGAAGVAIDVGRAMKVKNELQVAADAAALATASAMADKDMTEAEAEAFASDYFLSQATQIEKPGTETDAQKATRLANLKAGLTTKAKTTGGTSSKSFDISVSMTQTVPSTGLGNLLGLSALNVTVTSTSSSGRKGNALSMYLALDESGSMAFDTTTRDPVNPFKTVYWPCYGGGGRCPYVVANYISKMASLKAAAASMFAELEKVDPKSDLIRVGATSYDDQTKAEQPLAWGTKSAARYVDALPSVPNGGTDASGAMTNALNALKAVNSTEKTQHANKGNTNFERFIVLMTDGEMTGDGSVWDAGMDGKVRALCKQAKDDGIKIYTVAFMAPDRGKSLLSACSSGAEYYYEPDTMTTIVKAFGDIARKAAKTGTLLRS